MFFADLHCDTITKLEEQKKNLKSNDLAIDIDRLLEFSAPLQTFAIWHNFTNIQKPFDKTEKTIKFYYEQLSKNSNYIKHINNYDEFLENYNSYKISSFLTVEGGDAIEGSLDNLKKLYDLGVRSMALTWNNNNAISSSCLTNSYGLTTFGFEVTKLMEELKMIVDISHLSTKGILDVANKTDCLLIASHSNCKHIVNQNRNLNNYELHLLRERDGLIGLNLYLPFLVENPSKTMKIDKFEYFICKQIEHMIKIVGENNIALGTDFDGGEFFYNKANTISNIPYLKDIITRKFDEKVSEKVFGNNVINFLKKL